MPIYDYTCSHCSKRAEDVPRSVDRRDDGPVCCGAAMVRAIAPVSFRLKGAGWYADGYENSGGGK